MSENKTFVILLKDGKRFTFENFLIVGSHPVDKADNITIGDLSGTMTDFELFSMCLTGIEIIKRALTRIAEKRAKLTKIADQNEVFPID